MAITLPPWFRFALAIRPHLNLPNLITSVVICWLTVRTLRGRTEPSQTMSPDTVSSLFPDRPIRPLPKRRLRERLSPEVADSISYPPSAQSSLPLFHYPPYILKGGSSPFTIDVSIPIRSTSVEATGRSNALQRNGTISDDEKEKYRQHRSMLVTRSRPEILSRGSRESVQQELSRRIESQVVQQRHSASSSVDGYDSFENTNNKKKRKIPSAGDLSANGVHGLSSDINALALSTGPPAPSSEGHLGIDRAHHGSTSHTPATGYVDNNQGFSGPGRGRLGRSRHGRSPLRMLPDCNNTWPIRGPKGGAIQWPPGKLIPHRRFPSSVSHLSPASQQTL